VSSLDATTWQALGLLLTLLGLVLSIVAWRRRGPASGVRGLAWSLLPLAAGLTGTLRLLWEIGDSIVSWAVRLVFSPVVWLGVAVFGVSVMLFAVAAVLRARGSGRQQPAATPRPLPGQPSRRQAQPAVQDKDMDDIEAILRKHGIS
jgi:hypothetical protein